MDNSSNIFFNDEDFNYILDKDYLTELERSVLGNDYDKLKLLISRGDTIFSQKKLCNGYLERKYKVPHSKCLKNICYKTAVYYAYLINHNILRYIYVILKHENNTKYMDLINEFNSGSCGCELQNTFFISYNSNYLNHINQSKLLLDYINGHKLDNDCDTIDMCKNSNINIDILTLHCLFNNENLNGDTNSVDIMPKLGYIYDTNIKIINLLLNQQSYEIYKYYLVNKQDLYNHLDNMYLDSYVDINYINLSENKNILTLSLLNFDDDKIITKLLEKKCIIPKNINLILKECLDNGFHKTVKLLLKKIQNDHLYNPICLYTEILQNNKINDEEKLEMMKIIEDKQNVFVSNKLLIEIIKSSISFKCLTLLLHNNSFNTNIDQGVITFCIQIKKYLELDLLLKYGRTSLINGEDLHQIPLFIYLKETKDDDVDSLNILNTILRFEPKLDIFNALNESPLIIATKNNRKETALLLLSRGANPFLRDNNNENCLHISIKHNYDSLSELLCKYKSEGIYLVNEPTDDMKSCIFLSINTNNPLKYFNYLISVEGINLNYCDKYSKNILSYIISNNIIDNSIKISMIKLLLDKNINLKDIFDVDKTILSSCIEKDLYIIVEMIINKLIENKEIIVNDTDILSAIKNNKINNQHLKNIYSPAISYLRQNIFRIKRESCENLNLEKSRSDSKSTESEEIVMIRKKITVHILFMILFLVLGLVEKNLSKKKRKL